MNEKYKVKRGQIRRAEIAKTAERVFLEHGYAQTTMQMVAQSAGASKETLYRYFGTKEGLFTEVVRSRSVKIAVELDVDINLHQSPDNVVFTTAYRILKILSSRDVVRFYSWVIAETRRTPELGRIFYELGPAISREKFRTFLEEAKGQGSFSCDDTMLATRLFLEV